MNKKSKWTKRIGIGLIVLLVLLSIIGFIYEAISRKKANKISPSGKLIKIENHYLHYYRKGDTGPTVVFEAAFDPAGHLQWYNIQKNLPAAFTSISYDRSGILWSERGENKKTGDEIARELYLLLKELNAPKPYILVGHSFGGTLVRFFVKNYSKDVGGVIFVDSQCPDDEKYLSPKLFEMVSRKLPVGLLKMANNLGLTRIMFNSMFPKDRLFDYQNSIMPNLLYKSADAILEEQNEMNSIKKEAANINSFGAIPILVLTAADRSRYDRFIKDDKMRSEMIIAWKKMQKDFLMLSLNSKQIIVTNSGHYINQEQPKIVEDAIVEMVDKATSRK